MAVITYIVENGIIKAPAGAVQGDTGVVEGVTYCVTDNANIVADLNAGKDVCTTLVTSMASLFRADGSKILTDPEAYLAGHDITSWDTSSVTTMLAMFFDSTFNQDIRNWDTGSVTTIRGMFQYNEVFNQPIGNWDVSNVERFELAFSGASAFNQDIGGWNTGSATDISSMFCGASTFNQDIGNWDVSSVTTMFRTFYGASAFNQDIGGWNVGKVANMSEMFNVASTFNQDIGNWDTRNVTNMSLMFRFAIAFNKSIGGWDTNKVANMDTMFYGASAFNQDLSKWAVPLIATKPSNFDEFATAWVTTNRLPIWGTTPNPHIKFQDVNNQPQTIKIYSDSDKTVLVDTITTNNLGFGQWYAVSDNVRYYIDKTATNNTSADTTIINKISRVLNTPTIADLATQYNSALYVDASVRNSVLDAGGDIADVGESVAELIDLSDNSTVTQTTAENQGSLTADGGILFTADTTYTIDPTTAGKVVKVNGEAITLDSATAITYADLQDELETDTLYTIQVTEV